MYRNFLISLSIVVALCVMAACGRAETGGQQESMVAPAPATAVPAYPAPPNPPTPLSDPRAIPPGVDYKPTPTPGEEFLITPVGVPEGAPRSLGVVIDGTGKIIYSERGSTADKAGLKVGDVITSIDGQVLKDHIRDAQMLLWDVEKQHTIDVQRNGKTVTVTFVLTDRVFPPVTQTPIEPNYYL